MKKCLETKKTVIGLEQIQADLDLDLYIPLIDNKSYDDLEARPTPRFRFLDVHPEMHRITMILVEVDLETCRRVDLNAKLVINFCE